MTLAEYLEITDTHVDAFAAEMGVTPTAIRHWRDGNRTPRGRHMVRIKQLTRGAVCADDFLPASEPAE